MFTKLINQYYYRNPNCEAKYWSMPDCNCWHDEGTGPLKDIKQLLTNHMHYWRQVSRTEMPEWVKPHPKCDQACMQVCTEGFTRFPKCADKCSGNNLEKIEGDCLPPIGSRVYIRHGRDDDAHACIVTGYYVWGGLTPNNSLHRVNVRVVYEGTTTPNARSLKDCYPSRETALAEARANYTEWEKPN